MPQQTILSVETGLSLRTKINANFAELYSLNANNATQIFNFDATSIPSLALWLDAADSNTLFDSTVDGLNVTTDGATIARWKDKSLSSRDFIQTTENSRPILKKNIVNNKNSVRFDGVNDYMTNNLSLNGYRTFICYMVVKTPGGNAIFSMGYASDTGHGFSILTNSQATGVIINLNLGQASGSPSGSTVLINTVFKPTIVDSTDYSSYTVYINNISGTTQLLNQFIHPGYLRQDKPFSEIGVIRNQAEQFQYFGGGDYCEILVFTSELTNLQRQQVELYLNQKWALF
jgi:hypothetical protein